jgi:hypothetical protein
MAQYSPISDFPVSINDVVLTPLSPHKFLPTGNISTVSNSNIIPGHISLLAVWIGLHVVYSACRQHVTNRKLFVWTLAAGYATGSSLYPEAWTSGSSHISLIVQQTFKGWLSSPNFTPLTLIALSLTAAVFIRRVQPPHAVSTPSATPITEAKLNDISSECARTQCSKYFDCASACLAQSNGGPGWNSPVSSLSSAPLQGPAYERPVSTFNRFFGFLVRFWKKGYDATVPPPTMAQLLRDWKPLVDSTTDPDIKCMLFTILRIVEHLKRSVYRKDSLNLLANSVAQNPARIREYEQAVIDMHLDALDPTCYLIELEQLLLGYAEEDTPKLEVYVADAWEAFKQTIDIDGLDNETVIAFRKRFDETLRQRRQAAHATHLTEDECATIKTYQDLDKLLSSQRYANRYWRDPSTQEEVPLEFLQANSKTDLRQFLQARQRDWWQADQQKRGITTYNCSDCGDQVKQGHKCITTASEKIRLDKHGIPLREVSVVKGQAGRVREDKLVLPDISHMKTLIDQAQQKASKSKIALPPLSKASMKSKPTDKTVKSSTKPEQSQPTIVLTTETLSEPVKKHFAAKVPGRSWPPPRKNAHQPITTTSDNPLLNSPPTPYAVPTQTLTDSINLGSAAADESEDVEMNVTLEDDDDDGVQANVVSMTREEFKQETRKLWQNLHALYNTKDF